MRKCVIIVMLLPIWVRSQNWNFYEIDSKVESVKVSSLDSLSQELGSFCKSDLEKVRAIFRWISVNIDYNVRPYSSRKRKETGLFYYEPDDGALLSLNERIATKVLNKGLAFCDGYSRLFKALCDRAGIKCEIIRGYARTNYGTGRFSVNHTWNAVYIDNAWQLLDVTWASGIISYGNEYIRQFNNFYFLTPPEQFIQDHYPEDPQWSLLPEMPVYKEFNQSPFRCSGFIKAGISFYFPLKGVIEVSAGDTVRFELKARVPIRNFFIADGPVPDTLNLQQPLYTLNGDMLSVKYVIQPGSNEWLYIFCNDELALQYKLNFKRDVGVRNR